MREELNLYLAAIWKSVKTWVRLRVALILSAPRLISYLRDITIYGHHVIDTDFEYKHPNAHPNEPCSTFRFRTFIEFDGDVINFIPDPLRYRNTEWLVAYEEGYLRHQHNTSFFFSKLEFSTAFWSFFVMAPIIISINFPLISDIWTFLTDGKITTSLKDQLLRWGILLLTSIILPHLLRLIMPHVTAYGLKQVEGYLKRKGMI